MFLTFVVYIMICICILAITLWALVVWGKNKQLMEHTNNQQRGKWHDMAKKVLLGFQVILTTIQK